SLQGRLSGRHTPAGFELGTRALQLKDTHGPEMRPTTLRLAVEHPGQGKLTQGTFRASLLEFAPLAQIADSLHLPADVRRLLGELAPQGNLYDAQFAWNGELPKPESFSA